MIFHTFGDKKNKTMLLIHGVLTPWQIWQDAINAFCKDYFVIVPALDAHVEEQKSDFISVENEAEKIINYIEENCNAKIDVVCGLSMGAAIAYKIFEKNCIKINYLVLDGAPLTRANKLLIYFMTKSYLSIIHKSQNRNARVIKNFKKSFLPEKYLESYLKFADTMSDQSVINIVQSVFSTKIEKTLDCTNTKILFLCGTKANEMLSIKAVKNLKKLYPNMVVKVFKSYAHAELAIYHSEEWIKEVAEFIK